MTAHEIPITAAKLHNADGSYTETSTAEAGKTFTYCACTAHNGGEWVPDLQVAVIIDSNGTPTMGPYSTLQEAVRMYTPNSNTAPTNYIKLLHDTVGDITPTSDLYLDLNGYTVTGTFDMGGHKLYGMDSSARKDYVTAPSGKIVGSVSDYARTCQSPTVKVGDVDTYDRYVAIQVTEAKTSTLSFHHFNISVTGYRFELEAPQCALVFRGEFRGDEEAKKHLKSLGFTLKDGNDTVNDSREISQALADKFVEEDGDAYRFEFYLIRSFKKNPPANAYTDKFSATAQATFKNDETQNSETDETQNSDTKEWSFQEAWQNSSMTEKDKAILNNLFNDFGIKIQVK